MLDRLYLRFDDLSTKHGVWKIEVSLNIMSIAFPLTQILFNLLIKTDYWRCLVGSNKFSV